MDAPVYVTLTRQAGLLREMQTVAQNIANASTDGFRREGVVFSEHVRRAGGAPSLSMAQAHARVIDLSEGPLEQTGGSFDFAIRGEGFFLVETPQGQRLTRAGSFAAGPEGELATADGHRLLDEGGAPVFVPPEARNVSLARDGTLSADGTPLARIGLWRPRDPLRLTHEAGTLFAAAGGVEPMAEGRVLQGFVEGSNVDAVTEVSRMIEVQRAYEFGQALLDREDERVRLVIRTLAR